MDQTTRKKKKKLDNSGNESQRDELDQKRELQKCNETLTPLVAIDTASFIKFLVIECRTINVHKIHPLK